MDIRWGLLATGSIAGTFAAALKEAAGARLAAVGSRDAARARAFADRHGFERAYGSYEELAADPELDAIYVATPHALHERDTLLCLEHGKHVLCEKAFALNAHQARRMVETARAHDRLLMEAMWTRFLPTLHDVRRRIAQGEIGEARLLSTEFGIRPAFDPQSRLFAPGLGGGALLDLGVYTVSLGYWLFGAPAEVQGVARLGPTGTDDDSTVLLRHANGEITRGFHSMRVETPREAVIRGTEGSIRLHAPWWGAPGFTIEGVGRQPQTCEFELRGSGYTHMAEAFMELVRNERRDSQVIPLSESVAILETMDTLRAHWGLRYPGEDAPIGD